MHTHMRYMQKVYKNFSDEELMGFFIKNDKFRESEYNPMEHFRYSRVLFFHPGVLNVRFESLVGKKGGGSSEIQRSTIQKIYKYLGIHGINADAVANKIFSKNSPTFRKGKIGGYKEYFTEEQLKKFYNRHEDILRQYGYEK